MHVIIPTTEYEGLLKTGGLGDAIFGLANALSKRDGFKVSVIIPNYKHLNDEGFEHIGEFEIKNPDMTIDEDIDKLKGNFLYRKLRDVDVYLIENDFYFCRDNIHMYDDEIMRWAFFSRGIYELIVQKSLNPDVVQTNDYHQGFVASIFKEKIPDINCKFVDSIHNAYFHNIHQFDSYNPRALFEYYLGFKWEYDDVDILKWAVSTADYVITVSPDYADTIKDPNSEFGAGLHDLYREKDVVGFLNGLDASVYDRQSDDFESFLKVKQKAKEELQNKFNLKVDKDIPLFGYVCRLSDQKGSYIVYEDLPSIVENAQLVVLGEGDEKCNEKFDELNGKLENYVAVIDFDVELSKLIYMASDFFLMPSWFEPCGIGQLIALYHATLPIVTNVGGLTATCVI